MSTEAFERSDAPRERKAVTTEPSGRNWAAIGLSVASAFAVIALYVAGVWAVLVLVEALA